MQTSAMITEEKVMRKGGREQRQASTGSWHPDGYLNSE